MKKIIKKHYKGFSLVEVLIAIVLLAIIAVPLLQTVLNSIQVNKRSKELMAAHDCCSAILENIETYDQETLKTSVSSKNFEVKSVYPSSSFSWGGNDTHTTFDSFITAMLDSTSVINSDANIDNKIAIYSPDSHSFLLSNVPYSGYNFDIFIEVKQNSATTGYYSIYDVNVKAFSVRSKVHSKDYYCCDFSGSVFNTINVD